MNLKTVERLQTLGHANTLLFRVLGALHAYASLPNPPAWIEGHIKLYNSIIASNNAERDALLKPKH